MTYNPLECSLKSRLFIHEQDSGDKLSNVRFSMEAAKKWFKEYSSIKWKHECGICHPMNREGNMTISAACGNGKVMGN